MVLIDHCENFEFEDVKQVLDSNSRLPNNIWNYLVSLNNETSNLLVDSLETVQSRANISLNARNELALLLHQKQTYLTKLTNIFLTDTLFEEDGIDSVLYYYSSDNSFESLNIKFNLYLELGFYEDADSLLTIMTDMDTDDPYCNLLNTILDYYNEHSSIYLISENSGIIESLQSLATENSRAGVLAQNILAKVNDEYYPMQILYPESEERDMSGVHASTNYVLSSGKYFVYPNPSSNFIYVVKKSKSKINDAKIQLRDISSRLIHENLAQGGVESVKMDVSHLQNGLYFITIIDNEDSSKATIKVLINR